MTVVTMSSGTCWRDDIPINFYHTLASKIVSLMEWVNGDKRKFLPINLIYHLRPAAGKRVLIGQSPHPEVQLEYHITDV